MNSNYIPKPLDFIYPVLMWIIGTFGLLSDQSAWIKFGIALYILGGLSAIIILWSLTWDVFIRKAQALQYLFDSAKHLDRERINDLMVAMGLKPIPPKTTNVNVVQQNEKGTFLGEKKYHDIPASDFQLRELADGLLLKGMRFSRRPWTIERNTFTPDGFTVLQKYCVDHGLATENGNGYDPTDEFKSFLKGYLPSPTPQMATA